MKATKRKLTKKQRDFVNEYADTGNGTQSAIKAYKIKSPNKRDVAKSIASENLTKHYIKEELEILGFNENTAKEVVGSILKDETVEPQHRLKAAEQVFKVHGSYAPEKSVSVNIEVKQNREKLAKVATEVMEKLSHEELNG